MTNPYETDELLNQYLAFHYGIDYFDVPNYPVRCAQLCLEFMGNRPRRKALDLTQTELARRVGCSLGAIRKLEADEQVSCLPLFLGWQPSTGFRVYQLRRPQWHYSLY